MTTKATPERPMPGGPSQIRLIDMVETKDSLYELYMELPRLADELRKNPDCKKYRFNVSKTADDIEGDSASGWTMMILLHSMGKAVIKSIIGGTVASDRNVNWYPHPSQASAESGIYVVGMSRVGQGGKFLTGDEIADLVRGLERYLSGAAVVNAGMMTAAQRHDRDWVFTVDRVLDDPNNPYPHPRFINGDGDCKALEALVESLGKRIRPGSPTTRQVQSPLYVGCSTNLQKRLADYTPNRWFRGVNKPLALTASVLAALGTPVKLVPRVVLRTWKDGQLAPAERLVTTLAASLVCQTGFNAIQAGGAPGGDIPLAATTLAGRMNTANLDRNMVATLAELRRRDAFLRNLHNVQRTLYTLELDICRAQSEMSKLNTKLCSQGVRHWRTTLFNNKVQLEEKIKELKQLLEFSKLRLELINIYIKGKI
jgi:hypothetical protein